MEAAERRTEDSEGWSKDYFSVPQLEQKTWSRGGSPKSGGVHDPRTEVESKPQQCLRLNLLLGEKWNYLLNVFPPHKGGDLVWLAPHLALGMEPSTQWGCIL